MQNLKFILQLFCGALAFASITILVIALRYLFGDKTEPSPYETSKKKVDELMNEEIPFDCEALN